MLTLTFLNPLAPDDYSVNIPPGAMTGSTNSSLDGNGDGVSGDPLAADFIVPIPSDMNCDHEVNGLDIKAFVTAILSVDVYEVMQPN